MFNKPFSAAMVCSWIRFPERDVLTSTNAQWKKMLQDVKVKLER